MTITTSIKGSHDVLHLRAISLFYLYSSATFSCLLGLLEICVVFFCCFLVSPYFVASYIEIKVTIYSRKSQHNQKENIGRNNVILHFVLYGSCSVYFSNIYFMFYENLAYCCHLLLSAVHYRHFKALINTLPFRSYFLHVNLST